MDAVGVIRVVRAQARLACAALDPLGLVGDRIDEIPVRLSSVARTERAGRAGCFGYQGGGDLGRIILNVTVCHTEERLREVLLHELAHAVNLWVNGEACDTHGPQWQAIMRRLGQEPNRCHSWRDRG